MAHILVVDDEPAVRDALASQIRALRHRCAEAANGLEALEALHERDFDLVLTDVMMPKLNGFQFMARALPYLEGRTPIIVLSSVDERDVVSTALDAGAYDYLHKPTDRADLERVLAQGLLRRAEMLRLVGRRRGRGGPVPADALGERPEDRFEARNDQVPAGLPAFREEPKVFSIPRPDDVDVSEEADTRDPWWRRLFGIFRRSAA